MATYFLPVPENEVRFWEYYSSFLKSYSSFSRRELASIVELYDPENKEIAVGDHNNPIGRLEIFERARYEAARDILEERGMQFSKS